MGGYYIYSHPYRFFSESLLKSRAAEKYRHRNDFTTTVAIEMILS